MVELKKLSEEDNTSIEYIEMLRAHSLTRFEFKHYIQEPWYKSYQDFINVCVINDSKMIGHACAYKCNAVINGSVVPWYWGVDTFVLKEYRGKGYAKLLQSYLHKNLPNFSSAGYVPINGLIKRKVGGNSLFSNTFSYLPITNLLGFLFRKFLHKYFKINLTPLPLRRLPLYYWLNFKKLPSHITFDIVDYPSSQDEILPFINRILASQYDFYILRDKEYMRWKYIDNPNITYSCLVFRNQSSEIEAVAFISDVYKARLSSIVINYSKILDVFIENKSCLNFKMILSVIMRHYIKTTNNKIDGVAVISNVNYLGKISFSRDLLSTYTGTPIYKPYISYIDQDLEQMV